MDRTLYLSTIALLFFSIVSVYSLSVFTTIHFDASPYTFVKKQLVAVIISIIVMTILSKLDINKFNAIGFSLFILSFIAIIVMMLLPEAYAKTTLGARRWIKFAHISIAPTEFFKYGFVFFVSWSLARKSKDFKYVNTLGSEIKQAMPYFMLLIVSVAFIAIGQKDLGQVVVLSAVLMGLFFISNRSKKFFSAIFLLFIFLVVLLIKYAPHRIDRFKGWWVYIQNSIPFLPDSFKVSDRTIPLNVINSTGAIENGGILGRGLGAGQYKLGFLSEVHTDFVLAGISEEIGFIGLALVVGLFTFIIYRIFKIAASLDNLAHKYFAYGVGMTLFLSFIINAFGISGLIPIKGIAVPLLSYGGSQILATSIAIGMVLMLSKGVKK